MRPTKAVRLGAGLIICVGSLALTGCTPDRPPDVPGNALEGSIGNGLVTYTAPSDGTVYVDDIDTQKLVYQGAVNRGDEVRVDTDNNRITVNGKTATESTMNTGSKHGIYFRPASSGM